MDSASAMAELLYYRKLRAEPRKLCFLGRFARQMSEYTVARASSAAVYSDT